MECTPLFNDFKIFQIGSDVTSSFAFDSSNVPIIYSFQHHHSSTPDFNYQQFIFSDPKAFRVMRTPFCFMICSVHSTYIGVFSYILKDGVNIFSICFSSLYIQDSFFKSILSYLVENRLFHNTSFLTEFLTNLSSSSYSNLSTFLSIPPVSIKFPLFTEEHQFSTGLDLLLAKIKQQDLVDLISCILVDRPVVLTSLCPCVAACCASALYFLCHPVQWVHAFVPLINVSHVPLIQSPAPFIIGCTCSILMRIKKQSMINKLTVFVDLDVGNVTSLVEKKFEVVPNSIELIKQMKAIKIGDFYSSRLISVISTFLNTNIFNFSKVIESFESEIHSNSKRYYPIGNHQYIDVEKFCQLSSFHQELWKSQSFRNFLDSNSNNLLSSPITPISPTASSSLSRKLSFKPASIKTTLSNLRDRFVPQSQSPKPPQTPSFSPQPDPIPPFDTLHTESTPHTLIHQQKEEDLLQLDSIASLHIPSEQKQQEHPKKQVQMDFFDDLFS
ncbi:hypothetical protein RCL1_005840 [Eukaryota sp. TZLM3-RCL]